MTPSLQYLDATTVEQLNHLQLLARSVVEGSAVGLHRSHLKGTSVEFRQHRPYVPGDEPRRLDWRVLARTNRPFVKEYDEETNLRCLLMLDTSGSMAYGSDPQNTKFNYAARLAAALSYLMLAANESVGVALVAQKIEHWLAPRAGSLQLSHVMEMIEKAVPAGPALIVPSTLQVAGRLGRRALVIFISDFFSSTVDIQTALARLRYDRHEVICLRILHPDELTFPFQNWSLLQGLEGEQAQLCEPAVMRKSYLRRFQQHALELTTLCRSQSAELHVIMTDQPVVDSVKQFLRARGRG